MKEDNRENQKEGIVIESLPNTTFRIKLNSGEEVLGYLSGKMRMHFIRILTGDRILVEMSPDGGKGRIVYRYK